MHRKEDHEEKRSSTVHVAFHSVCDYCEVLCEIDQSRKDCLGSKGGMSTESALYNTYMALPDQHAAQDVFDSSRVNARVSTRFSR